MPELHVPIERLRFGQTSRRDAWWTHPLVWSFFFIVGFGYLGWGILQPSNYWSAPYLTPLASPLFYGEGPHAIFGPDKPSWWPAFLPLIPGLFILPFPGGFRLTCYYYRGAYYKALWGDPPACAVGEPLGARGHDYRGEAKLPLIVMNLHRYFLYFGIILCFILAYDVYLATKFPVAPGSDQTTFGIGLGTVLMAVNVVFISLYTFSCHSFRHLIGGVLDVFSRSPARKKAWDCVTCINKSHGSWAMISLYTMCSTDLYVRLCAAGVISDWRII